MTKLSNEDYDRRDRSRYLQTFRRYPVTLSHGKGSRVWDVEGNMYIDALAGIAVNNTGHSHPHLVEAIRRQAGRLMHISNFYLSEAQVRLSEKLCELSGLDRVFLTNSGAESVEGAIKVARKYAHSRGRGGDIISFEGSFHGRTLAAIATGKKKFQAGFEPIPHGFRQIPFNDIKAVESAAARKETAAFMIEPVQGEGGIRPADPDFLRALRNICDENDIVLIFDEIQCGMGRTGHWFAKDYFGLQPDIMTLAKALGGGMPIGALLTTEKAGTAMDYGDHGTTFGGNPLACTASLATIGIIEQEDLLKAACEKGDWIRQQFASLQDPDIVEIRGLGLMTGIEFRFGTKPLVREMLANGVLANSTAENVLRLLPPLNIPEDDLKTMMDVTRLSLSKMKEHAG